MDPTLIEAVIFDFDRTLAPLGDFVRWRDAIAPMRRRYLEAGIPVTLLDAAPRGCFGLFAHVARHGGLEATAMAELQDDVSGILAAFEEEAIGKVRLFAGGHALLGALRSRGVRLGIVSSNPGSVIRRVLEDEGIADAFASVVGRERVTRIKPDPQGMLICRGELESTAERTVAVGDNVGDIEAARAAGLLAIGVAGGASTSDALRAAGAVAVHGSLAELHRAWFAAD